MSRLVKLDPVSISEDALARLTGWRIVLDGAPRTKKTSNRIIRAGNRRRILPSKAHERWFGAVFPKLAQVAGLLAPRLPLRVPVNVAATFYRDAERGDAVGYYQALADLLERAGVVENDVLIRSWDGSRLRKDAAYPRIELEIFPCGPGR